MVGQQSVWDNMLSPGQSRKRTGRGADSTSEPEIYGKKPKIGKFERIKSETKALLLQYFVSPLSAIRDVREFRDSLLLSDPKNKDYIQASFDDFGRDINDYSLGQINELLTRTDAKPIFMASMTYGSRDDSLSWIEDLLKFQFNDDEDLICKFLFDLVNILDKNVPKLNAFCVHSPPSGGKNFFFDMIFALCLNYGQLGQANRNNVFAFQEAPNKRVLLWNEPNYESALTDTLKLMFGGDPYTVRVKHNLDTHVRRTPIIILTNNIVPFMTDAAFRDRLVQYKWKSAPMLKNIDTKPHPLAFFDLLNKYNVIF